MNAMRVEGIGLCAPGLPDWPAARPVLAGSAPFEPQRVPQLAPAKLPPTERRRANVTTRWALQAAGEAVQALGPQALAALPTIFASADGDGEVLATVLRDLAQPTVLLSPTTFHNSVYNAPAGYWSIAAHAPAPSITLCAGEASFAAGLLEAGAQCAQAQVRVLLVAYEHPFPADAPIGTPVRGAFACALLLAPPGAASETLGGIDDGSIGVGAAEPPAADPHAYFAGNAAACALPLFAALARPHPSTVALPYLDETHVTLRVRPCASTATR